MTAAAPLAGPYPHRRRATVCGCDIDVVTLREAVAEIDRRIAVGQHYEHTAMNAAKLVRLQHDDILRNAVDRSELTTADGQAVVWAARLLGHRLPERVAGIDLMEALLELAARKHYRVFILGARRNVLDDAVARIRERFPGVPLAGWHHGYFSPQEEPRIVGMIRSTAPDLLFVALETPAKELFIARNRDQIATRFVMGVGGAIDVIAGVRRRAPRWMQRAGLEWLYRFAQDPRRLARRYLVGNTQFVALVLREALRGKAPA